jgi:hypothetical protein
MPHPKPAFPLWVIPCGMLLALAYLPTLAAPFDFLDDGNLVYPSRGLSAGDHVRVWWDKVRANVEHLGPFRPVVWAHWEVAANVFGDHPLAWRAGRLGWCGLAAGMLLWLMRELRLHPLAAVVAAAAAIWNPYRNDIWTSLTLAEGVAMPYALFALVAARKGATADRRRWAWDAAAVLGLLLALGCKNTFVALIPPMILLRTWAAGVSVRRKVLTAAGYAAPVALVAGHLVYVKLNPGPCHYHTPGPSWGQAVQFASWLKGAAGLDFLGVGVLAVVGVLGWRRFRRDLTPPAPLSMHGEGGGQPAQAPPSSPRACERAAGTRSQAHGEKTNHASPLNTPSPCMERGPGGEVPALAVALALLLSGFVVYLPVSIMCGRYTMPAVWGADVLLAVLLTRLIAVPFSWAKGGAWVLLAAGLVGVLAAGIGRQEKLAARSHMLWQLLAAVERDAPPGAVVEWVSGSAEDGQLNAEEGIHFYWHLLHRGRADVRVRLVDPAGGLVQRVELPPPTGPARYRIAAHPTADPAWRTTADAGVRYHLGRRTFAGVVQEAAVVPLPSGQ